MGHPVHLCIHNACMHLADTSQPVIIVFRVISKPKPRLIFPEKASFQNVWS